MPLLIMEFLCTEGTVCLEEAIGLMVYMDNMALHLQLFHLLVDLEEAGHLGMVEYIPQMPQEIQEQEDQVVKQKYCVK